MFIRSSTLLPIAALVVVVAAMPNALEARGGSSCNTGSAYCCNSDVSSTDPLAIAAASLVGISLAGVEGLVGLTCSPIIGVLSGASCSQQPVCCTGNNYSGVIVIGCSPVTL